MIGTNALDTSYGIDLKKLGSDGKSDVSEPPMGGVRFADSGNQSTGVIGTETAASSKEVGSSGDVGVPVVLDLMMDQRGQCEAGRVETWNSPAISFWSKQCARKMKENKG